MGVLGGRVGGVFSLFPPACETWRIVMCWTERPRVYSFPFIPHSQTPPPATSTPANQPPPQSPASSPPSAAMSSPTPPPRGRRSPPVPTRDTLSPTRATPRAASPLRGSAEPALQISTPSSRNPSTSSSSPSRSHPRPPTSLGRENFPSCLTPAPRRGGHMSRISAGGRSWINRRWWKR